MPTEHVGPDQPPSCLSSFILQEPQIHESAQGPRVTPAAGRTAPTPRPVPGPRSAATPRPGRPVPGPARPTPPAQRAHPAPVPAPAPAPVAPTSAPSRPENRSAPQLQLIPAPAGGALDAAEEAVDLLLESGRAPGDILVLTTGEQHPWAAHELSFGDAAYWAQQDAGDDVFFADASAVDRAKPRPIVVVAVNGDAGDTVARALPVARDRAAALLIVCGDPQTINSALGAGV
ncbi:MULTISPECIES: hypothetical protein [Streptomyces]|uniref:hypothetical protein n=1 Tax=Streptomyces TaxID=1883 RepID=UPI00068F13BC|nr:MULTISPECIES: hypothetical protein [Streptomyces]NDZ65467.1 hypothetical protein [Streptomyces cyaneofuscatus]ONI49705.1 Levansucrase [Streptomyces sp. IB2014 011-1]RDV48264.1 hypothetical protein DDV98_29300 [Streptomyces sp. IB2014 011-12]CAD5936466.1 Levansucrase [Streptomyces sp. KY70]CAD5987774.1 Levansucrase [Streptomyces sp. KY75]